MTWPTSLQRYWHTPALRIEVRLPAWSPCLAGGLVGLVLLALWNSRLQPGAAVLLSGLALLYAPWAFARVHRWNGKLPIRTLSASAGKFEIGSSGRQIPVRILPGSLLWRHLLVLRCGGLLEPGGACLMLFSSTMSTEQWRRLRLQFRRSQGCRMVSSASSFRSG